MSGSDVGRHGKTNQPVDVVLGHHHTFKIALGIYGDMQLKVKVGACFLTRIEDWRRVNGAAQFTRQMKCVHGFCIAQHLAKVVVVRIL